jgi:hypothetical protein
MAVERALHDIDGARRAVALWFQSPLPDGVSHRHGELAALIFSMICTR